MPEILDDGTLKFDAHERGLIKARWLRELSGREEDERGNWTDKPGQITEGEFDENIYICEQQRINPLMNHIYLGRREGKLTRQTSIDALRLQAERTKCYAPGTSPTEYYYTDGKQVFLQDPKEPMKAVTLYMVRIYVKKFAQGEWHEFSADAHFQEYAQKKHGGALNKMWGKMPHSQLAKCGEAKGLRRAFPTECAGLYIAEEIGSEETMQATSTAEKVKADLSNITKGKTANRGHGKEGFQKAAPPDTKAAVPETKAAPAETAPKPEEKKEATKPKTSTPTNGIEGRVVDFVNVDEKRKPLKTSKGTEYVKIQFDDLPKEQCIFYCYHKSLFECLSTTIGEKVALTYSITSSNRGEFRNIENVISIGDRKYVDGKLQMDPVNPSEENEDAEPAGLPMEFNS